jgi:hypothetical protein
MVIRAANGVEGINLVDIGDAFPMAMRLFSSPGIVPNDVQGSGGQVSGEALVERAAATGTVARIRTRA